MWSYLIFSFFNVYVNLNQHLLWGFTAAAFFLSWSTASFFKLFKPSIIMNNIRCCLIALKSCNYCGCLQKPRYAFSSCSWVLIPSKSLMLAWTHPNLGRPFFFLLHISCMKSGCVPLSCFLVGGYNGQMRPVCELFIIFWGNVFFVATKVVIVHLPPI